MDEYSDHRRRLALLALIGSGAGLTGALRFALAQPATAQGLRRARGEITVNGRPASVGDRISASDVVATGRRGLAVFVIGQDAFLMRASSRAEFSGKDTLVDALRLATGKLLSVFGGGRAKRLSTHTATVGIRGTGAYLESDAARTYFCLCYGTADVAAAGSAMRESYTTTHHESPRYIYGDGRIDAIAAASVINHTDAELIMLEGLVGRTPPKAFMDDPFRY